MINQDNVFLKINLYVLSLGLLFIFIIIITIRFPCSNFRIISIDALLNLFWANIATLISALALVYCLFSIIFFDFKIKGAPDIPIKITKLEKLDYEHLTFLTTYIIPLACFDFSNERQIVVLVLLLVVIGVIYIKSDMFYANPSLALLGFRIYRINASSKTREKNEIIIISRDILEVGDFVSYIKLDDKIFYARRKK